MWRRFLCFIGYHCWQYSVKEALKIQPYITNAPPYFAKCKYCGEKYGEEG